ncbi:MAG: signal peptidase II [[Ruminococcus] gnavus]|nr:signal peptidase II [Mediterraneibacter gnavus]
MKKVWHMGISAFLAGLDLTVKEKVEEWPQGEERPFAGSKQIMLRKVHNPGMCMSFLGEHPDFVKKASLVLAGILTVCQFFVSGKKGNAMKQAGLALGTAGAWSNTWDRWTRGYVVDYIGFQTPSSKWSKITYNLGDFFLVMGSVLFLTGEWRDSIRRNHSD